MIKKVAVIGAGTMGNGIAHVFGQYGFEVALVDISETSLEAGLTTITKNLDRQIKKEILTKSDKEDILRRINTSSSLEKGVNDVDLVVEAATEDVGLKCRIFEQLDNAAPDHAILSTNTSSISITKIASATKRAEKVIGMHFMNPVPVMKLVEVIEGYDTSSTTTQTILDVCEKIEKTPISVSDYPGFVANRILMPMINEAIYTLHEGVASVDGIDQVMQLGMAHPMGPLKLADFIGLDVCLSILKVLQEGIGLPKYAPCPLLVNMVNAGHLGVKSKSGFYDWTGDMKQPGVAVRFRK